MGDDNKGRDFDPIEQSVQKFIQQPLYRVDWRLIRVLFVLSVILMSATFFIPEGAGPTAKWWICGGMVAGYLCMGLAMLFRHHTALWKLRVRRRK